MTRHEVHRALVTVVTEAWQQGGKRASLARSIQYAEGVVMPMVDLALDQAAEAAAIQLLQARVDPEPIPGPDAPP